MFTTTSVPKSSTSNQEKPFPKESWNCALNSSRQENRTSPREKARPAARSSYINNKLAGQGAIPVTIPLLISLGEGLNVGRDPGSPTSKLYQPPFEFTGRIYKVTVDVSGKMIQGHRRGDEGIREGGDGAAVERVLWRDAHKGNQLTKGPRKKPHGRKTSKGFSAQVPSILRSRPSVGRASARVEVSNARSGSANLSSRLRFPQCEPKQRFAISVKSNLSEMTCIILAPGYLRSRDVLEPVAMDD